MEISQQIANANKWIEESSILINGSSITTTATTTLKTRVSLSLLHLSLEHCRGITSLIRYEVFGSALALLRPQVEAYIRDVWFDRCAQEEDANIKGVRLFLG